MSVIRNDTNLTREEALEKVKGSPRIKVGELQLRVEAATLEDARQIWAGMIADPGLRSHELSGRRRRPSQPQFRAAQQACRPGPISVRNPSSDQVQGDAVFFIRFVELGAESMEWEPLYDRLVTRLAIATASPS